MTPASSLRMLHLGLGAFHRAHQAAYMQRLLDAGERRWTLVAGNIRPESDGSVEALSAQGGAYTLETVTPSGERSYRRITAISAVVPWQPRLAALIELGAAPETRIVSFTVTEAGYSLDATSRLDLGAPEIGADLAALAAGGTCRTIYGALTLLLRERMRRGAGALTLLCCDNLRHNGERVRRGLLQFIDAAGDPALRAWVEQSTACPSSMVDRITPRPTAEVQARVKAATGVDDRAAVMCESFSQWVIEDAFASERPRWEDAGAELVASVAPYEEAKIRLLNATHSCVAWAGTLAGTACIHEGVADAAIRAFAERYLNVDAIPALGASPLDLGAYGATVLARFGNPFIRDTNERVAVDSFAKLAGFVMPTIRDRLAQGQTIDAVAVLPALYLAWLQRWRHGALPYAYQDQALDAAAAAALCDGSDPLAQLANEGRLWGGCAGDARLLAALRRAAAEVARFTAAHGGAADV